MIMHMISDLNVSINNWYRVSKLPKLLKKVICKSKRKKLMKHIKTYSDTSKHFYTSSEVYEFLSYAAMNTEKFPYMYIDNLVTYDATPTEYGCLITFPDDNVTYSFLISNSTNESMSLIIRKSTIKGNTTVANLIFNELGLANIGTTTYSEETVNLIGGLNSMIGEMIRQLLTDELARSERIYEI